MSEQDNGKKKDVVIEVQAGQMKIIGHPVTVQITSAYEVVASTSGEPIFVSGVFELEKKFGTVADAVLYAYAHDGEPISPRIGVKDSSVSEPTMRALAEWEWGERQKHREDAHRREVSKRERVRLRLAFGAFVLTALGLFAKSMGWY